MGFLVFDGTSGNFASASDIAAYTLGDTFTFAVYASLDDWTPAADTAFLAHWQPGGAQRGFIFGAAPGGGLRMFGSDNGTTNQNVTSSGHSFTNGTSQWVGANFNGGVVQFFTGGIDIDNPSWVQLGSDQTFSTITSIHNSTAALEVGSSTGGTGALLTGKLYKATIYDDLTRTTTVFDADFTDITQDEEAAGAFVEDSSNAATVTLNGSAWTYVRFGGGGAWRPIIKHHLFDYPAHILKMMRQHPGMAVQIIQKWQRGKLPAPKEPNKNTL